MPAIRVEFHPEALSDAHAAKLWYSERSERAAQAFLAEIDRAVELIAADPEPWSTYRFGTRRVLLRRFPYALVYRIAADRVTMFAVAHTRRRPRCWRERL